MSERAQRQPPFTHGIMFWQGYIASNPGDLSHRINVILPDMDPDFVWKNCRWQARDAVSLPSRGDVCLLILDNLGEGWVIAWWPFDT